MDNISNEEHIKILNNIASFAKKPLVNIYAIYTDNVVCMQ